MTANFIHPTQISIPAEFLTPLYGLIPSFLIPFIIEWINEKRQRGNLRKYMYKINYDHDKLDASTVERDRKIIC